jgi:hypothetical protein
LNGICEALIVLCGLGWDAVPKDSAIESIEACVFIGVVGNGLEFAFAVSSLDTWGYDFGFRDSVTEPQLPERGAREENSFGIVGIMDPQRWVYCTTHGHLYRVGVV